MCQELTALISAQVRLRHSELPSGLATASDLTVEARGKPKRHVARSSPCHTGEQEEAGWADDQGAETVQARDRLVGPGLQGKSRLQGDSRLPGRDQDPEL